MGVEEMIINHIILLLCAQCKGEGNKLIN